ncbi:TIGR02996 domain-containing protein [Gemmata sp. G18]|uniref:TIGR02996 domain-containing protein n=1 Tax=Gemmata palustris TaxID=2822762 RepID=A0ABS5BZ03_9BACT|nr:TIGR02996 domain-containing protein [Gemmata palustris]MBP3958960.1 TIGR02996 domain-containing protein [Gemmata palustris]
MNDEAALLAAIIAHADEDTPRLAYADWLDEHRPDAGPSPASGPSARADYIRVQCRLAQRPYDDPEYPALLEREGELAHWLESHTGAAGAPELPTDLEWFGNFTSGDDGSCRRGFPEEVAYTDYDEEPEENVERMVAALPVAFATTTVRALRLEDVYGAEIAGLVSDPVAAGLRGLALNYVDDGDETTAVRAIAKSKHLTGLRRLDLEFSITDPDLKRLAKAPLDALEELALDQFTPAGAKALGAARWFRALRALRLEMDHRDALKAVGELPAMPNLGALTFQGSTTPTTTAARKFITSGSFPRLGYLEFSHAQLTPDLIAMLCRGSWALRHLKLHNVEVRKAGAEALANATFAGSLRVLDLSDCQITSGGVQALAGSAKLAGLRHLDLSDNPIGPGGLAALARSPHLRGLRKLSVRGCNSTKAPIDSAALINFLTALQAPDLRHLNLSDLPVGVRGANVIAAGGPFANLTRLELADCALREKGAKVLVGSTALGNLTVLDLSNNNAGRGAIKLANPKTFPRLGHCDLNRNRLPKGWLARLRARPGVSV